MEDFRLNIRAHAQMPPKHTQFRTVFYCFYGVYFCMRSVWWPEKWILVVLCLGFFFFFGIVDAIVFTRPICWLTMGFMTTHSRHRSTSKSESELSVTSPHKFLYVCSSIIINLFSLQYIVKAKASY